MPSMTPQEYADKLIRRQTAALDDMRKGVEAVTEAPSKKAVAKQAKMKANLVAAIDNGKWARNLSAITVEEWKEKMLNLGIGRVQAGVEGARAKIERFYARWKPFMEATLAQINRMPDSTLEERIAKSTAYMRAAAKFNQTA